MRLKWPKSGGGSVLGRGMKRTLWTLAKDAQVWVPTRIHGGGRKPSNGGGGEACLERLERMISIHTSQEQTDWKTPQFTGCLVQYTKGSYLNSGEGWSTVLVFISQSRKRSETRHSGTCLWYQKLEGRTGGFKIILGYMWVWGQPGLYSKFEVNLGYMRPWLQTNKKERKKRGRRG